MDFLSWRRRQSPLLGSDALTSPRRIAFPSLQKLPHQRVAHFLARTVFDMIRTNPSGFKQIDHQSRCIAVKALGEDPKHEGRFGAGIHPRSADVDQRRLFPFLMERVPA